MEGRLQYVQYIGTTLHLRLHTCRTEHGRAVVETAFSQLHTPADPLRPPRPPPPHLRVLWTTYESP